MTEKRFIYMEQFDGFCDVYDNGKPLTCMRKEYVEKTVDLLNEQDKTIKNKEELIKAKNEQLDDVKQILQKHNQTEILKELGWL